MTRAMKESGVQWIGRVPAHWTVIEPRRIFEQRREREHADDVHLTPSQKYGVLPQEEYVARTGYEVVRNLTGTAMQHVEPGDFISHLRTFQGGLELARQSGKVSPAYTVVKSGERVCPQFFKYVLKSAGYISQIASITEQLRDGQTMRFAEFNLTKLPLPPFDEQRRIADYLDQETAEIDALTEDFETSSRLLAEREKWVLEHELSETWSESVQKLAWYVSFHNGDRGINYPSREDFVADGIPFVNAGHLNGSGVSFENMDYIVGEQYRNMGGAKLQRGDLLYCLRGSVGKMGVYPRVGGALASSLVAIRSTGRIVPEYLQAQLGSARVTQTVHTLMTGSAQPNLSVEQLAGLRLPVPDVTTQENIARRVQTARQKSNSVIESNHEAIRLAKERRAALISAAVTGQIDVTQKHTPAAEQLEAELVEAR